MANPTNIYFARSLDSGLVKIGKTHNVPCRVQNIANEWESVVLLATVRAPQMMETRLHLHFGHLLEISRGQEWFRDDGSILALIETVPVAQRGLMVFRHIADHLPLRYATTEDLLFPTRPFPADVIDSLGLREAA